MRATQRLLTTHVKGSVPLRVLAASGQLGYGMPASSFERGLAAKPDVIGADMGSIDPGPYYLGSGNMAAPLAMVRDDLQRLLLGARALDVPLIIGSAGTAGAAPQLHAVAALLRDIAKQQGLSFRLVTIATDLSIQDITPALSSGSLQPLGPMPSPTPEMLQNSRIVAQCGVETFQRALALDPDVLLVGRACDTAIFASLPEMLGYPTGLALQMAKIIECTSLCCVPSGRDAMLAHLSPDSFVLESMNPLCHATVASVAAHALYEQADPHVVEEPTGTLHLSSAHYTQIDPHRVQVAGASWTAREVPTLKVEGAYRLGHRAVLIAAVADPGLLTQLDSVLSTVLNKVRGLVPGDWQMHPHIHGQGAVNPLPKSLWSLAEAGLVIEFVAPQAATALQCASVFKQNLLHQAFEGRMCTAGNLAFPFTPSELDAGEVFAFSLYHTMPAPGLWQMFEIAVHDLCA